MRYGGDEFVVIAGGGEEDPKDRVLAAVEAWNEKKRTALQAGAVRRSRPCRARLKALPGRLYPRSG